MYSSDYVTFHLFSAHQVEIECDNNVLSEYAITRQFYNKIGSIISHALFKIIYRQIIIPINTAEKVSARQNFTCLLHFKGPIHVQENMTSRYLVLFVLIGVFDFGQSLLVEKDSSRQTKNGRLMSVFQVVRFQVSLLISCKFSV